MAADTRKPVTVEYIVEQTKTLYSLPLFYDRLNEAINHPRSSLADIGRVISEDQGLTARLLKLANSPLFGYHATIDSITKALTLIGIQQLRDLALAVSIMGSFSGIQEDVLSMRPFWKHNIACGILSRSIAICRREVNQERYFVSGMLHDVGKLVMCGVIPEIVREIELERNNSRALYYAIEQKHLGFDHGAVGSALLEKWKIPPSISEPIACHHSHHASAKYPVETAILHLADVICHTMGISQTDTWQVPPLDNDAWRILDIPVNQLDTIIRQSESQIEETFAVLTEGR
jgi:HD-like signal output (HDOD) protein